MSENETTQQETPEVAAKRLLAARLAFREASEAHQRASEDLVQAHRQMARLEGRVSV